MLPCGSSDSIKNLQPVQYNLKDIMFPNYQWQIMEARGQLMLSWQVKSFTVIPATLYCAWPEGPEFENRYMITHQDLARREELIKGLQDTNMASSHTAERGLLYGEEWQGKYWAQVHRETVFMTSCVQGIYPGQDQNMVYMNNLSLAKQSSSSKTHDISFSLNLLALQRQDLGGPSNNIPSVSQLIFLSSQESQDKPDVKLFPWGWFPSLPELCSNTHIA